MKSNLKELDDGSLVKLFRDGNNHAFDVIVQRHVRFLTNTVAQIIKNGDVGDIVQEAFIKAMDAIQKDKYHENGALKSWLAQIAYNHAINIYRKRRIQKVTSVPNMPGSADEDFYFPETVDNDESLETQVIERESEREKALLVDQLIGSLSDYEKEVIVLRYFQKMKFHEIAAYFGEEYKSSIRTRFRLILQKLRREYQNHVSA